MTEMATKRSSVPLYLAALFVLLVGGFVRQVRFLPLTEFGEDGFQSQLVRVMLALQAGELGEAGSESWLVYVHLGRLIGVAPFLLGEALLGPAGQVGLLVAALMPLVLIMYRERGSMVSFLPLLLPLALSGRGVLVATGVAYLVLYMQREGTSRWFLWLGALWVNLSSASVLMALLLLLFAKNPNAQGKYGVQRWVVVGLLSIVLVASGIDKFAGFAAGGAGYEAHAFQSDNVVLVALSRSTLIASFIEGNYLRGFVYAGLTIYFLFKSAALLFKPGREGLRRIVICCLPGVPLEGMGMLALIFPLVWLFLNFDPSEPKNAYLRKVTP
ncbi:MAG: hypothetical protein JWQ80_446 [Massilia sp.]|nr:hypothetical protein [Massilia sp.]